MDQNSTAAKRKEAQGAIQRKYTSNISYAMLIPTDPRCPTHKASNDFGDFRTIVPISSNINRFNFS